MERLPAARKLPLPRVAGVVRTPVGTHRGPGRSAGSGKTRTGGNQSRSAAASLASRSTRAQSFAATVSAGTIQLPPTQPTLGSAR